MTLEEFRDLALSLPEATEGAHMGHPDFRVRGKIFATLWPDQNWGMVKLTPQQQRQVVQTEPEMFVPVKGGWGRRGCTNVLLEVADVQAVHPTLIAAWRNAAPKKLAEEFEEAD